MSVFVCFCVCGRTRVWYRLRSGGPVFGRESLENVGWVLSGYACEEGLTEACGAYVNIPYLPGGGGGGW